MQLLPPTHTHTHARTHAHVFKHEPVFLLLTAALFVFRICTIRLSIAAPHQVDTGITAPKLVG